MLNNRDCAACSSQMPHADRVADPYTQLCLTCWAVWQEEAGVPLVRYGKPGTVCVTCGMGFGGVAGFDRHRHRGRCLSPAELLAQNDPMTVKDGIWVTPFRRNAKISPWESPRSDSTEVGGTHG